MRIIQKTSKKPLILGGSAVILLLAASISYYVFAMNGNLFGWKLHPEQSQELSDQPSDDKSKIDMKPATQNDQQESGDAKLKALEKAKEKPATALTVSFTSTSQANATLRIRALIQQVVTGTCTLTLTKGTSTVTKTAPTYPNASTTTCQGFDLPVSELSAGRWDVRLDVAAGKLVGSATTTVTIE